MHLTAHSYPITERGSQSMNTHDDDLRIRLGRIRNRGARYKGFFAEVRSAARNEGYIGGRSRSPRGSRSSPSYFGRGRGGALRPGSRSGLGAGYGASPLPHAGLLNSTRRVLVKARIVRHRGRGRQRSQRTFATSNAMV